MSTRHYRVVRQLQQRLQRRDDWIGWDTADVLPELDRRVRRLRSLGREYSAVQVSEDVVRLCAPKSACA